MKKNKEHHVKLHVWTKLPYTKPVNLPQDEDYKRLVQLKSDLEEQHGKNTFVIRDHFYGSLEEHPLLNLPLYKFDKKVAQFYKRVLAGTLAAAVDLNLAAPVTTQLSLLEELAIIRQIANRPLSLYSNCENHLTALELHLAENADIPESDKAKLKSAIENLQKARDASANEAVASLKIVSEFCERAAKIDALCRDKFSIHSLNSVVAQITRIIADELHDNKLDDLAVNIEERIRTKLVLPLPETAKDHCTTSLTPDQVEKDVLNMDDMIPASEETSEETSEANESNDQ